MMEEEEDTQSDAFDASDPPEQPPRPHSSGGHVNEATSLLLNIYDRSTETDRPTDQPTQRPPEPP